MSDLKLRTISIRNWQTIRNAELEFPEKGLVLVLGRNTASNGKMESVGSGKTALGEAISRTLVNIPGRFKGLGLYSYKEKGDMYVRVGAELCGKPLVAEIGHKCPEISPTGEGIRFSHGDSGPVERGKPLETRAELSSIIGITPELAAWTVFIDGDKLQFTDQSERQAVNLLMSALRQPSWDSYQKRAGAVMNDAKTKLDRAKSTHENTLQEIEDTKAALDETTQALKDEQKRLKEEAEGLKRDAKKTQDSITTHEEAVQKLRDRQTAIKKTLKELEEKSAKQYADLEKERLGFSTAISQLQIKRNKLTEDKATLNAKLQTEKRALTEMTSEPDKCPTCGKDWDKEHSEKEIEDQKKKVLAAQGKLNGKVQEVNDVDKKIADETSAMQEVEADIREMRTPARNSLLSQEYERNDEAITERANSITNLKLRLQALEAGPDRAELIRLQTLQTEHQKTASEAQNALEDAAQGLAEAQALVQVTSYWYEAFGPCGIPNMILGEAIAPLNEVARRISLLMTGGTIEVSYDTSRELASGDTSAELVINVKNKLGSKRAAGSSKGEARLTNLIVAEALSEVGNVSSRIGYRWYDEILNSQDQVVRRSIVTYLRELAHRLNILVFIVDHHQEVASQADYILIAEKTTKGTELFWG